MKNRMKKIAVMLCVLVFGLMSVFAYAAEKQWYVLKNKKGTCSVRELKAKSPTTIAGPFATKAEAQKVKAEKCPKQSKDSKKSPATH